MSKISHTFDPLSGIESVTGVDPLTNRMVIKHRANIEPSIEYAKLRTKDEDVWKEGVKKGLVMVGHIPAITIVELMTKLGIDVYKAPMKDIRAGLEKLGKPGFIWKS